MSRLRPRRAARALGVVIVLVGLLSGCAINVADLPLPAAGVGGPSYRLTAVFADALNLPEGAHVKLNGDDVGRVRDITARDYTARVAMAIRRDVRLPVGTTAELRQATPLGEVFVALQPPTRPVPGAALRDGDTIGLADTASSARVEDLLAALSTLVNGGGLAQIQTIVQELNAASTGRAAQIAHVIGQSTQTMTTLSDHTADIDRILHNTERLTLTLNARRKTVDAAFDDLTPGVRELAEQTDRLTRALRAAGRASDTADDIIQRSGDDIRSIARDLGPILRGFAETRPILGPSLRDIVHFGVIFQLFTRGESAAGNADFNLTPLIAPPRPGDRPPGPNDFVDGEQSFAEHLQHQFSTFGETRPEPHPRPGPREAGR
jgi:virulence factor Mce-like protein